MIPFAADEAGVKHIAARLITDAGFEPFDVGALADSKPLDPEGALFGKSLTVAEATRALGGA